jgi:hypothetical protein
VFGEAAAGSDGGTDVAAKAANPTRQCADGFIDTCPRHNAMPAAFRPCAAIACAAKRQKSVLPTLINGNAS